MKKYRKKPITVQAFQFDGESPVPNWAMVRGMMLDPKDRVLQFNNRPHDTEMEAQYGDWVIDQGAGDRYPCKPDIFEKTYEAVLDAERATEDTK